MSAEATGARSAARAKTSSVRWVVLGLICAMYLLTYLDRVNISTAAPVISKQFGFDKVAMGLILAAFTWSYAIFQVPGGWLGDRFGPRKILGGLVAFWSIMTSATAIGSSISSFWILRFMLGVGEAGAFPTATRAMQNWFTRAERGFAQGLSHGFSRLGAAVVPPISVWIMITFGWQAVFWSFGLVGIVWVVVWAIFYRNLPEDNGILKVDRGELAHLRGVDEKGNIKPLEVKAKPTVPWSVLLKHPNMWAIMIAYFTYVYCLWIFLTWLPSYLVDYRHFSLVAMGFYAALPLFAGAVGDTFGGWFTDYLLRKTGRTVFSRRIVAIIGMVGCVVFIVPAALTDNPMTAVYSLTASMFFLECTIGPSWAVPMDVGGEYSGTVSGMMNMGGNIGGAISPMVFGILAQYYSWVAPFIVAAVLLLIGAGVWAFWLNPEISVVDKGRMVAARTIAGNR